MLVTLLILNILCGVWNLILSTTGSTLSNFLAPLNWFAVGVLVASLIHG